MQKIGKSHPIIKLFKETIKTNKHKNWICTDDLEVLSLALNHQLTISYLLYSSEENYHEETKELLKKLIEASKETYELSNDTYQLIQTKENHAGSIA
ncbi:MAG: hypothetical protein K2I77_02090, partial [Anaeroplasmataceae bacterium]|nr:hypothetical protein [Anaeroplasmataceae bacterium]